MTGRPAVIDRTGYARAVADTLAPGEVAQVLRVQPRAVRRIAETYEAVFEELPRVRPEEDRSPRLWTMEAVRRVQVAHLALKSGGREPGTRFGPNTRWLILLTMVIRRR